MGKEESPLLYCLAEEDMSLAREKESLWFWYLNTATNSSKFDTVGADMIPAKTVDQYISEFKSHAFGIDSMQELKLYVTILSKYCLYGLALE